MMLPRTRTRGERAGARRLAVHEGKDGGGGGARGGDVARHSGHLRGAAARGGARVWVRVCFVYEQVAMVACVRARTYDRCHFCQCADRKRNVRDL